MVCRQIILFDLFLSTLSLRRATMCHSGCPPDGSYFYPRSPCGERRIRQSTAGRINGNFYPRSPCGERQQLINKSCKLSRFLSTLSLRRATDFHPSTHCSSRISIHALLAESDAKFTTVKHCIIGFLSTLSLRRATSADCNCRSARPISIHALLAESDPARPTANNATTIFLSTLSLRRATRVPLAESTAESISIHALLAESDQLYINRTAKTIIFLSTLSLRRATAGDNAV